MRNRKMSVIQAIAYSLFLILFLYALIRYTGINPLGDVDALQTFWGTLVSETYNFYKIIPLITILFVLWVKRPAIFFEFYKLHKTHKKVLFYYSQLVWFVMIVVFSWTTVMLILMQIIATNPENVTYSTLLAVNYIVNLLALCSILLTLMIWANKTWAIVIMQPLLYLDQWLNMHWGQSIIFYHGLMLRMLPRGSDLSTIIYDFVWNVLVIALCLGISGWVLSRQKNFSILGE